MVSTCIKSLRCILEISHNFMSIIPQKSGFKIYSQISQKNWLMNQRWTVVKGGVKDDPQDSGLSKGVSGRASHSKSWGSPKEDWAGK